MTELRADATREPEADAYWLGHCHGFEVRAEGRRVGVVEDVLYGAGRGRPSALAVRGGLLGGRLELVPVEGVEAIEPRHKRISLRQAP